MAIISTNVLTAKVEKDDSYYTRWINATGEGVMKAIIDGPVSVDDTTLLPSQMVVTQTGTSPVTAVQVAGKVLKFLTAGTEYNGNNSQFRSENFKLEAGKPLYLGVKFDIDDATQSDVLIGLCELKTDLLNTSASHDITSTNVEGVFFVKLDGSTTIRAKMYKDGAQTGTADCATALNTSSNIYEIYFDGEKVFFYYNNAQVTCFTSNLPDGDLTVSINVRAGSAAARTAYVSWLRCIQVNY